jgi:hypothetical protein
VTVRRAREARVRVRVRVRGRGRARARDLMTVRRAREAGRLPVAR